MVSQHDLYLPWNSGGELMNLKKRTMDEMITHFNDVVYQKENYLPPLSKSWWLKWLKQEAGQ